MIQIPEKILQRRPLITAETAGFLLDCSPDEIRVRVELGKLTGFDLRSRQAHNKSCLRILARSLNGPVHEAEVCGWIPSFDPLGTHLVRLFGVSQALIALLLTDGSLKQIGKPAGPKASPRIDRESLVAFLKSRRIGAPANPLPSPHFSRNAHPAKNSDGLHTVLKRGQTTQ